MGSDSDWPTMKAAAQACDEFGVPFEARVVSAHRTPLAMAAYARTAVARGLKVIVAGAGGAAHLPGMVASHTPLPVIGVPVESTSLKGFDALLSIVQMPGGCPSPQWRSGTRGTPGCSRCKSWPPVIQRSSGVSCILSDRSPGSPWRKMRDWRARDPTTSRSLRQPRPGWQQ